MNIKPIWIVVVGIATIVMFLPYTLIVGPDFDNDEVNFIVLGSIIAIFIGTFALLEWNHRRS